MRTMHTDGEVICDHCGKTCRNQRKHTDHLRDCPVLHGTTHEWKCDEPGCDWIVRRKTKSGLPQAIKHHKEQRCFNFSLVFV